MRKRGQASRGVYAGHTDDPGGTIDVVLSLETGQVITMSQEVDLFAEADGPFSLADAAVSPVVGIAVPGGNVTPGF